MSMLGFPHRMVLKRMLFTNAPEISSSQHSSTIIGISPLRRGMPISCNGWDARSDIRTVTISSESSSSPSWRFPISLMAIINETSIISVLNKIIAMFSPASQFTSFSQTAWIIYSSAKFFRYSIWRNN